MNLNQKIAILEGLLFICGDEGINLKKISYIIEESVNECINILTKLKTEYKINDKRGLKITFFSNKYYLTTKQKYYQYYLKLSNNNKIKKKLSQAALEILAIIAYKGPISKPEIEKLRGICSNNIINKLQTYNLINKYAKSELPGKPMTYKITEEFLKIFNLTSLKDLPKIKNSISKNNKELFK